MLARNKLIVKWSLYGAAALVCLLVEGALLQRITIWGVIPFLYPLLAAIPATRESPAAGAAFALCVGVVCDLLLPGAVPCLYTLVFPLAGLCAGLLAQSVLPAGYLCSLAGTAAAFLLLRLSESSKVKGDAAIALISTGALAIGVMAISFSTGANMDVYNYMFGSILAMSQGDVRLSIALSAVVLVLYMLFYPKIFAVTFDETFPLATGVRVGWYNVLIALLTALTIVLGMRLMGSLLISSLVIFPALTSMRVFQSFRCVVISSACLSIVCFLIGLLLSYAWSTPAGASVVCVNIAAYLLFWAFSLVRQRLRRKPMENA